MSDEFVERFYPDIYEQIKDYDLFERYRMLWLLGRRDYSSGFQHLEPSPCAGCGKPSTHGETLRFLSPSINAGPFFCGNCSIKLRNHYEEQAVSWGLRYLIGLWWSWRRTRRRINRMFRRRNT